MIHMFYVLIVQIEETKQTKQRPFYVNTTRSTLQANYSTLINAICK